MTERLAILGAGVLGLSFLMTAGALPLVRRWNLVRGHVDHPGGRKTQAEPVPYGAATGLGIGLAITAALGVLAAILVPEDATGIGALLHRHAAGLRTRAPAFAAILLGAGILALMGRMDDRRSLGILPRLAVQVAAGVILVLADLKITLFLEATWLQATLTVLWVVFVVNTLNFIDNMDGLLTGVAGIAAATVFALAAADGQLFVAAFALALVGGLLAVYRVNRRPARMYLGDEGSLSLGYLLAALTIVVSYRSESAPPGFSWRPFIVPLLILFVPLVDGVTVITSRLRRGITPWTAGRDHLSHRLAARHGDVVAVRRLWATAWLASGAALALGVPTQPLAAGLALGAVCMALSLRLGGPKAAS
ncbi:MAG: undecaprenyl/decaprenyl-phosphate alpha-N-acetylglucosaminyl 1-phosphate transferase [Planctomycetes bacterium]|nr:undecaprenyl/decaprenyl-phosphate alpha-N-acetylglucosaminyl 1-phosphate transferase [Planctomycetota bacterium]